MSHAISETDRERFLEPDAWETLVGRVQGGMCTPFLGPELLSSQSLDPRSIAEQWAREEGFPFADWGNLPRVADYVTVRRDFLAPRARIKKVFREVKLSDVPGRRLYDLLAQLPFPLYVGASYDDLMMQALLDRANGFRDPHRKIFAWNSELKDPEHGEEPVFDREFEATAARPVVFHWYGHISRSESLVLTERDHMEFLFNVSTDPSLVPAPVDSALGGTYLVFLGFRLFDLNFQILLRTIKERIRMNRFKKRHVAVQFVDIEDAQQRENAERYLREYLDQEEIRVVPGEPGGFVEELYRRVEESKDAG